MPKGIVLSVGINDLLSEHNCPFYCRWTSMLRRCYRTKPSEPSYQGCLVSDEWLRFSVFKAWMQQQPWHGNEIDKDILCRDRKIYQQQTCVFIPRWLNVAMIRFENPKGSNPVGVKIDPRKITNRYQAQISEGNRRRMLGSFETPQEAHQAWRIARSEHLYRCAERYSQTEQFDRRVLSAVLAESALFAK